MSNTFSYQDENSSQERKHEVDLYKFKTRENRRVLVVVGERLKS